MEIQAASRRDQAVLGQTQPGASWISAENWSCRCATSVA